MAFQVGENRDEKVENRNRVEILLEGDSYDFFKGIGKAKNNIGETGQPIITAFIDFDVGQGPLQDGTIQINFGALGVGTIPLTNFYARFTPTDPLLLFSPSTDVPSEMRHGYLVHNYTSSSIPLARSNWLLNEAAADRYFGTDMSVSYTHLTLPTTPYV